MSDEPRQSLYGDADAKSAEDIKPLGMMDILSGVFSEPVELFQRLSKKPQWVGALVIVVVMALLLAVAWAYKFDNVEEMAEVLQNQLERAGVSINAEMQRNLEVSARYTGIGRIINYLFIVPIQIFIGGLVWWGVGLMSREDTNWWPTYMHGLTVAAVPKLVLVPYYFIGTLIAILKGVGVHTCEQMIPSSLGFWIEAENPKLSLLYDKIDIFLLAGYALLFFAARHTLRAKPWGAVLCVALSLAVSVAHVLMA